MFIFTLYSQSGAGIAPFLFVLALFSGQLQWLPKAGGWMLWVRKPMGWVLVGMAAYFVRPVLPGALKIALPVAVALAAWLHLGWLDKNQASIKVFPWLKTTVGTVCLVLATLWITAWAMRGPGDRLAHLVGTDPSAGDRTGQTGDHRLLRRLVHPLPGVGGSDLSPSRRGPAGPARVSHAQGGCRQERRPA